MTFFSLMGLSASGRMLEKLKKGLGGNLDAGLNTDGLCRSEPLYIALAPPEFSGAGNVHFPISCAETRAKTLIGA
jgi:hypothetical protein